MKDQLDSDAGSEIGGTQENEVQKLEKWKQLKSRMELTINLIPLLGIVLISGLFLLSKCS